MKSEWRVTSNCIDGKMLYGVYRLRDINAVDHSGNREQYGPYVDCKDEAQRLANQLNNEGEKS